MEIEKYDNYLNGGEFGNTYAWQNKIYKILHFHTLRKNKIGGWTPFSLLFFGHSPCAQLTHDNYLTAVH
jgi:hypothetical protein